ncbi:hypothetical protein K2173_023123 [Erythroxylum novogranatense]|uniref:Reverse transcriptase domain-containing protein n=1 Tax=Erythroxylum novogranatense TaxID=1862640 RepID=A0AAV8UAM1_9ROSI|nr:hypothetical protein K2173_023123 [Erythroxylum novogranatense]
MEVLRSQLSFAHCFSVDSISIGRGLSIFWSTDIRLHVSGYSSNFIDCEIRSDGTQWRLTGFYGFPDRTRRQASWNLLRALAAMSQLPWLCCGDFNDIEALYEKLGGPPRLSHLMSGFCDALSDARLSDILQIDSSFTYTYQEGSAACVKEKLDRACSTAEWSSLFCDAICSVLVVPVSDHSPLLIDTASTSLDGVNRRFRFDNSWLSEPDLGKTVVRAWASGATFSFSARTSLVMDHIRLWGKQRNRLRWAQKETIKRRLGEDQHTMAPVEIRRLKGQWNAILEAEDVRLKQQAKAFWFRHGDKNTKYFHNIIRATESSPDEVLRLVKPLVDESANNALIAPFSDEEFRTALFQMDPNKAPGPDGLNPAFFQKFWSTIGGHICQACREWLQLGALPLSLATTLIVLIPKCDNPLHILSKALATRLKSLLTTIISLNQSAFVPGRLITDNFIVAFETLHDLKQRSRGNSGSCALKIDIAKAYDRVSWDYLLAMLTALGFSAIWIKWMRMCISNISYMISMNGSEVGPIIPSRGLRQGDPLSPYLFLLVAEGLSLLLTDGERRGVIHGCWARLGCPRISHLFFADDSLLFFNGMVSEATHVKHILGVYEATSGQSINYGKSGLLFSPCIALDVKQAISALLGVHLPLGQSHYLGLPSLLGRSKRQIFSFLKDRIWKRREILIKAVIQAIPTYCMNVFLIPATTCSELQVLMNKFWWGGCREGSRGINWLSWDRMCYAKSMGGMGFRDLRCFNTALLGKQGWRLIVDTTTLSYQVLKAKYFPRGDFLTARLGTNYSFVWMSVLWRVGDGQRIFVNRDPWIPKVGGFHPDDAAVGPANSLSYFSIDDVHDILGIPLSSRPILDKLIWICDRRGIYLVKTAYYEALADLGESRQRVHGFVWQRIWSLDVPPKVRDFLWRCCRGVLPTKDNLQLRGVNVNLHCLFCHEHESMQHVFLDCPLAKELWRLAGLVLPSSLSSFLDFFAYVFEIAGRDRATRIGIQAWKLWLARNDKLWHDKRETMSGGTTRTIAFPLPLCFRATAATTLSSHWLAFIDGSIFAEAGLLGFSILFEDGEGSFSLALSGYEDGPDTGSIFIDTQLLIHALNSRSLDFSYFGLIISECKAILCTRNDISVSWIRHSENGGAHSLARASVLYSRFQIWVDIPACILDHYSSK